MYKSIINIFEPLLLGVCVRGGGVRVPVFVKHELMCFCFQFTFYWRLARLVSR